MEFKGDGESWEEYAHRLEKRIKEQREQLRAVQELRDQPVRRARKQIAHLERLLGQREVKLARQHDGLRALQDAEHKRALLKIQMIELQAKADRLHRVARIMMRRLQEMADLDPDSS